MRLVVLVLASWATCVGAQEAHQHDVLNWIHKTPGGYVHPHQEVRIDPATGLQGMFATKFIPQGTVLCQVPWSIIIESSTPDDEDLNLSCGTVKALATEMRKGNQSRYAPYVNHLLSQPDNLPSAWSDLGQQLLRTIVAAGTVGVNVIPPDEPTEWLVNDWYGICRGSRTDKIAAKAAMLVVQSIFDGLLVPGQNMYGHRNGNYFNTLSELFDGDKHVTFASRDIQAGEPIHTSYNKCFECTERTTGYGTAEILRDFGFLEPFPQIWHYLFDSMQFELDIADDGGFNLTWMHDMYPKNDHRPDDRPRAVVWLRRQIRRLQQIRNVDYKDGNPGIPEREWNLAWAFQKANIQAMTVAASYLVAMENGITDETEMRKLQSIITLEQFERDDSHYDTLQWEVDDIEYTTQLCGNEQTLQFHDHVEVDIIKTHYQNMTFSIHPTTRDVVLDLETTLQIASNYRPYYHEYMIHAATRFMPKVERVIFIGGGDSMLLDETLKYPDIKLVVGLELDQTVTRKSFKYFRTSPRFEDPRVEWWFGDATKSLLLLSQEYWQSFDLVLVDLSETVMSLSVTKELDVLDALTLLLKPEGIMVKNELYMEQMSRIFDYSMDIVYECPVICGQVQVFGSNKVHFLHDPVYDHGIDTFLYHHMHDPDTRHRYAHDFRINNATQQQKCGQIPLAEKLDEQSRSAGIMEIVEVEQVSIALDGSLEEIFLQVIQRQGFRPLAAPIFESGMLMIVMKEGYVLARLFPEEKYCSLDIHLWGRFDKLSVLRKSLTDELRSALVSRFRVVVGGMYGSDTWTEDRDIIGPQLVQTRKCEVPIHVEAPDVSQELITAAFTESMSLVAVPNITAVVICMDTEDCLATKLIDNVGRVEKIVKISACPNFGSDDIVEQYTCEISTTLDIKSKLGNDFADLVVVDSSTPFEMVQIMSSILSRDDFRQSTIRKANVIMVWAMNAEKQEYLRHFLDRYRKQHQDHPITRGEIWMQVGTKAVEFGILVTEDTMMVHHLSDLESNLKDKFQNIDNVQIELRGIYGGQYPSDFPDETLEFLQSEFETAEDFHHYFNQKPLACQTIFQLEEGDDETSMPKESLNIALVKSLEAIRLKCTTQQSFTGMGEGGVITCMNPKVGNAVVVWDGRKHLDISLYLLGDAEQLPNVFLETLLHHVDHRLQVALRDDMPRGIGRVINFPSDILTPEALKEFYDSLPSRLTEQQSDDDDEFGEIDDDDDEADEETDDDDGDESSVYEMDSSLAEL